MDGGVCWLSFQRLKGLVEGSRENAWRLRHEQTVFHHESEFSVVSLQKNTPFRNLCAIQRSPLNICSFASSIVSLCVHEKALHMSVRESRWDFPREVMCHPMHRCASIAPSLLRPRRKPCQFGEKCSSPPSETVSLSIAARRLFHQGHRTWMTLVPRIPFCPSRVSIMVPFEWCALHGV